MNVLPKKCEFRSVRSRLTWQWIGGIGSAAFLVFLAWAATTHGHKNGNNVAVYFIGVFGLAWSLVAFANSFRAGRLIIAPSSLVYKSSMRNRRFNRSEVTSARVDSRITSTSPRRVNMPVLTLAGGEQVPLVDMATPFAPNLAILKSIVEIGRNREESMESLSGLVEWINSWVETDDWISDSVQPEGDST
jgi:hypothetical protein